MHPAAPNAFALPPAAHAPPPRAHARSRRPSRRAALRASGGESADPAACLGEHHFGSAVQSIAVLSAAPAEDEVEDALQSCRVEHVTTALGSNGADEAAYFVESGSDDDAEEAPPAYVVDEGSDTE